MLGLTGSCDPFNPENNEKGGFDPNAILKKLREFVLFIHGSFELKQKLIDDFNAQNPECSKKSIEKRLKELFVRDKRERDPKIRYYFNPLFKQ